MPQQAKRALIVHADDLGLTRSFNEGVREGYQRGFLTSTSLRTNGPAFQDAVEQVIPDCPNLGVGVHLNIVEGRTQRQRVSKSSRICDSEGYYKASFGRLLHAYHSGDKATFDEIEDDYRSQIEIVLSCGLVPDHLNSHRHSHGIPGVFEIACKLAAEYNIPFVRLAKERFYLAGEILFHMALWYPTNLIKHLVLNIYSGRNAAIAKRFGVRINDYFIGVNYTGHMTSATFKNGLAAVSSLRSGTVEVSLHPCKVLSNQREQYIAPYLQNYSTHPARAAELSALLDMDIRRYILQSGWELRSFSQLARTEATALHER